MPNSTSRGSGTATGVGTTWTNLGTNATDGAIGTTPNTYATWTSSVSGATASIDIGGFNFGSSIPADAITPFNWQLTLRLWVSSATRIPTVTWQCFDGSTAIGSPTSIGTPPTAVTNISAGNIAAMGVTLAQLRSSTFKVRVTATRAAVTQSATFNIDHAQISADYTLPLSTLTQSGYQWFQDNALPATSTALVAQNTQLPSAYPSGQTVQLRVQLGTNIADASLVTLEYRTNAGAWGAVPDGGAPPVAVDLASFGSNGSAISASRITGGTGTFTAGKQVATSFAGTPLNTMGASAYTEHVWILSIVPNAAGQLFEFRVTRGGSTTSITYSQTPSIQVASPSPQTWSGSISTIGIEGISGTIVPPIAPMVKVEALTDTFDTEINITKWNNTSNVVWDAGRAKLSCVPGYGMLGDGTTRSLIGSRLFAKMELPSVGTGTKSVVLQHYCPSVGSIQIIWNTADHAGGGIRALISTPVGPSVAYNPVTHAWWQIRETGGTLYFEYSSDGLTWNVLHSVSTPAGVADGGDVIIYTTYYGGEAASDLYVDNVNVAPPPPSQTWIGNIATIGVEAVSNLFIVAPITWSGSIATLGISGRGGTTETPSGVAETFFDDWEAGNNAKWPTISGTPTVIAGAAYAGSFGLRCTPVAGQGGVGTSTTKWAQTGKPWSSFFVRARYNTLPSSATATLFTIQNLLQSNNVDCYLDLTGRITLDIAAANRIETTFSPTIGQWFTIRCRIDYSGTTWTAFLRINDVDYGTISSTGQSASSTRALRLASVGGTETWDADFDDLRLVVDVQDIGWLNDISAFVPGTVTWQGSTSTIGTSGITSAFVPGPIIWGGSIATVGAAGITGNFISGPITWSGSIASVGLSAISGAFSFYVFEDPTDISGLRVWIDASTLVLADGAEVSTWPDMSGNNIVPTTVGTPAPKIRNNALEGKPVVRLTANEGRYRWRSTTGVTKDSTLFAVVRLWGTNQQRVISSIYELGANWFFGYWQGKMDCAHNGNGWLTPDLKPTATNAWKLYSIDSHSTPTEQCRMFSDGTQILSASGGMHGWNNTLGLSGYSDTNTAEASDCEFAELVLYNRELSTSERQDVENYLRMKWIPPILPITWTGGSIGTIGTFGVSGEFTVGEVSWSGSIATVGTAGITGTFISNIVWAGDISTVGVTSISGVFTSTNTWLGSIATVGTAGQTDVWISGPVTWSGSTSTIGVSAQTGIFTSGATTWLGSIATIGTAGFTDVFIPGPITWLGNTSTVGVSGQTGIFVAGSVIWTGSTSTVGISGISSVFSTANVWVGTTSTVGVAGISGSFNLPTYLWPGSIARVGAAGLTDIFVPTNTWVGSTSTIGVSAITKTFTTATLWIGTISTVGVKATSGIFGVPAIAQWNGVEVSSWQYGSQQIEEWILTDA